MDDQVKKTPKHSVKKIMWENLLFFISTTVVGVIGSALYIYFFGIALPEILLLVFVADSDRSLHTRVAT